MRVLAITKIFPNSLEPLSSPFNRQQFEALKGLCDLTVLEAIPHVPFSRTFGMPARAAKLADLPAREVVSGIETHYLRQLYVPRIGVPLALALYMASSVRHLGLVRSCDVVLGTWAYPDGCAATLLAHALGKPVVVKVHGSDINVLGDMTSPRLAMSHVLPQADAMVSVSRPLGEKLQQMGVPKERIHFVTNGVDTSIFHPRDRIVARTKLGLPADRPLVVFVGRVEDKKGADDLFEAWAQVRAERPDATLALVGDGSSRKRADELARSWGTDSLRVLGPRPLAEVADWVAACDLFTLPSHAEGTPNVVLEALASGRPVVASNVGGIPDVLADPRSGILVPPRAPRALATALLEGLTRQWDEKAVVAAGPPSWQESAANLYDVLDRVVREHRATLRAA